MTCAKALMLGALMFASCAGPTEADGEQSTRGVLVMAHGGSTAWNASVAEAVAPVQELYPTEIAFGMARTSTMREAVSRLEQRGVTEIAVVRMFISGDSFLETTESILGLRELPPAHAMHMGGGHGMEAPERIDTEVTFRLSRSGVVESSLVDDILLDRVLALSTDPAHESVLVLAHGPGDDAENQRWLASMEQRLQYIREQGGFREVRCETLREDWPEARAAAERRIRSYVEAGHADGGRTLVVPFRIAGFGPYKKVLEGLDYVADGQGFCPHPNMTRWIRSTAQQCFEEVPDESL